MMNPTAAHTAEAIAETTVRQHVPPPRSSNSMSIAENHLSGMFGERETVEDRGRVDGVSLELGGWLSAGQHLGALGDRFTVGIGSLWECGGGPGTGVQVLCTGEHWVALCTGGHWVALSPG